MSIYLLGIYVILYFAVFACITFSVCHNVSFEVYVVSKSIDISVMTVGGGGGRSGIVGGRFPGCFFWVLPN